MRSLATLFLTVVLLGIPAVAQDDPVPEMEVSLRQSIALSLNNNRSLEVARYVPWISEQTLISSYGVYDTVVFAEGSSTAYSTPSSSLMVSGGTARQRQQDYAVGVRRLFPNGVIAELRASTSRAKDNFIFSTLSPTWNNRVGLSLTFPILRNGGEDWNTLTMVIRRVQRDMSIDDFETALQESVFSVQSAYFELVFAREGEMVADEARELARKLVRDSQRRFEQGQIAKVQVTEAQAQVAQREQDLLVANQSHGNAMDRLRQLIDPRLLEADDQVFLTPSDGPIPYDEGKPFDARRGVDDGIRRAFTNRADLRRARRAIRSQELTERQLENQVLPRLDFVIGAAYQGVDSTFPSAHDSLADWESYDLSFAFAFEIPLENTKARADLAAATLERRRLQATRLDLESTIIREVREAVRAIKTRERSISAAREQVRLAREKLDAEQARFREGLTTTYFVQLAQNELTNARLNELRARIDHTLARLGYQRATGTLLRDWGIDVRSELHPRAR
jgi:outer membrane protein TolC